MSDMSHERRACERRAAIWQCSGAESGDGLDISSAVRACVGLRVQLYEGSNHAMASAAPGRGVELKRVKEGLGLRQRGGLL